MGLGAVNTGYKLSDPVFPAFKLGLVVRVVLVVHGGYGGGAGVATSGGQLQHQLFPCSHLGGIGWRWAGKHRGKDRGEREIGTLWGRQGEGFAVRRAASIVKQAAALKTLLCM